MEQRKTNEKNPKKNPMTMQCQY